LPDSTDTPKPVADGFPDRSFRPGFLSGTQLKRFYIGLIIKNE
jgi:hypothetical protein